MSAGRAALGACGSGAEEGEGEGRKERGRGKKKNGEKERKWKKRKNRKEKGKRKIKRNRERERETEIRVALIAASTAGPVGRAQRLRVRADEATGKRGRGCWRSDVWNRERFRELWFRVLGGF